MENLVQALSTVIIQIVIVFAVLIIISIAIMVLKLFSGKKAEPAESIKPIEHDSIEMSEESSYVIPEPANVPVCEEIDDRIIAVIMASIAANMKTTSDKLIVRSIRRSDSWSDAVRKEKLSGRFN